MRYYDINYTSLSDGTVLVQYADHNDDDKSIKPTYQALRSSVDSAIAYIDKLNAQVA